MQLQTLTYKIDGEREDEDPRVLILTPAGLRDIGPVSARGDGTIILELGEPIDGNASDRDAAILYAAADALARVQAGEDVGASHALAEVVRGTRELADQANGRPTTRARLEYLRSQLRAECISMSELVELQGLASQIDPGDVELLEAAGVPEHGADCPACGKQRPDALSQDTFRPGSVCPHCGHVEPHADDYRAEVCGGTGDHASQSIDACDECTPGMSA